jgi:putative transposase
MTMREIQGHLHELYGVEVSPDLISRATEAVVEEVKAWQSRPLDPIWPIVYLDALVVKVRDHGVVANRAVYLALGVNLEGKKELLGLWMAKNEGAKFWLEILTDLKNRGLEDVLIMCCDGLKGFPEAIEAALPLTVIQTCIVHMIRHSLRHVPWKERRTVAKDLKEIYTALNEESALEALQEFEARWGETYPMVVRSWRSNWERITPFLAFPQDIRRVIYTTNAIESLNRQVRKVLKNRGHFPSDQAAMKLVYLALEKASQKWTMPIRQWGRALNQLAIHFEGRIPV